MIRQCSWCDTPMGEKEPLDDKTITHCICEKCNEGWVERALGQKKTLSVNRTKENIRT